MTFERFIARRYLFGGKNRGSISAVAFISVAGVALGVFALIVVIAVMDGFDKNLMEKFIGANAHITINSNMPTPIIADDQLLAKIRNIKGVKEASPVIQRLALLTIKGDEEKNLPGRQAGVLLQGLDLQREKRVTAMLEHVEGKSLPDVGEIVLGSAIGKQQLYAPIGQEMTLVAPVVMQTEMGPVPLLREVVNVGFFRTGFPQVDEMVAYTSLESARAIFNIKDEREVDGIRVAVNDPDHLESISDAIQQALGPKYRVMSWARQNETLFNALRLEKWALFVILLLIVLVAAFNIIGTLTMVVLEKTREIGIMKSMGASERRILRVFLNQGLAIGGTGVGLGAAGGLLTCFILGRIPLPGITAAYLSDHIPVLVQPHMVVLTILAAFAIVLAASLLPARQAARLDPVEALRYE